MNVRCKTERKRTVRITNFKLYFKLKRKKILIATCIHVRNCIKQDNVITNNLRNLECTLLFL